MEQKGLLPVELTRTHWETEDNLIRLALGWLRPKTPLQWIMAVAEGLSHGRNMSDSKATPSTCGTTSSYQKSRLFPVFERLMQAEPNDATASDHYSFCYPLREASPQSIFPISTGKAFSIGDEAASGERRDLFEKFMSALENLVHRDENTDLWFEHFESLVMLFTTSLPSAGVRKTASDVSLFDHLKNTAALATALYAYHKVSNSMTIDAVKDFTAPKFLLISGDFYGIQNFIFCDSGDTRKNRSKILRGRSFAVSLFSELAADMLCREIGLPPYFDGAECRRQVLHHFSKHPAGRKCSEKD